MTDIQAVIEGAFDTASAQNMDDCLTILIVSPGGQIGALAVPMRILPGEIEKIGAALAHVPVADRDRFAKEQVSLAMERVDSEPRAVATAAQFAYYRLYRDLPTETFDRVRFMSLLVREARLVVLASDNRDEIIASALAFLDRGELSEHEAMVMPSRTIN